MNRTNEVSKYRGFGTFVNVALAGADAQGWREVPARATAFQLGIRIVIALWRLGVQRVELLLVLLEEADLGRVDFDVTIDIIISKIVTSTILFCFSILSLNLARFSSILAQICKRSGSWNYGALISSNDIGTGSLMTTDPKVLSTCSIHYICFI